MIGSHLYGTDKVGPLPVPPQQGALDRDRDSRGFGMQAHLALSCKALLPILGMGHVRVRIDWHEDGRPLLNATRRLMKQPGSASHLEVFSKEGYCGISCPSTRHLIDLRCAHAPNIVWCLHGGGP